MPKSYQDFFRTLKKTDCAKNSGVGLLKITNASRLASHGDKEPRKLCIDLMEVALESVNLYSATRRYLRVSDGYLYASGEKYDLSKLDRLFVIGAGKATFPVARALEEILGDRITKGIISVKNELEKRKKKKLDHITIIESGHPVPDENSVRAADAILDLTKDTSGQDLFICAITGGASSLLASPAEGISLRDKVTVNKLLLNSGAPIKAINSVRNHISKIKGGNLARLMHPARILNLIAIDEVEGLPWGPTVPDNTTFADSIKFLELYNLWTKVPDGIRNYLKAGSRNKKNETPKQRDLMHVRIQNVILARNEEMLQSVHERAKRLGLNASILSSKLEGESSEVGRAFGSIAREIKSSNRPFKPPCVLIAGGETTVKVDSSKNGKGGPSQEFVLGAALEIAGEQNIAIASLDTDGTDGTTEVAGGMVDTLTLKRSHELNYDALLSLRDHNSHALLRKLGDTIRARDTETNVMDLDLAVIF